VIADLVINLIYIFPNYDSCTLFDIDLIKNDMTGVLGSGSPDIPVILTQRRMKLILLKLRRISLGKECTQRVV